MSTKYAFSKGLKELRFLFCHSSAHGDATRTFLKRAYPTMKKHNPYTPILIREAADIEPRIFARYEFGREKQQSLLGLSDKEIEQLVTTLVQPKE
ncbi:NADH-ubiquinone oxidoreductase 105 kDa subunit [Coccidioides immitis RS]|uniref:NADH-ubiquinone oxidoreductase 105 kDa subunit n=7 Tax=Coccidioides TaxID=5500 RepID=J3K0U5_COCIM|nr:NADH-ubiquinone oxidoreductase 105 kDa subunit [Coccidioides immitis RS]XP_003072062.1 NADH-ubiquinone oxidoreductase, putative [Coccidioides posadasii C735 delta SOWgp]EFW18984.1 NADH-ubiquinone oxidoreductase 105 kDa subunit [Coccidioides posadasii str. Silveira]KMM71328.1 NADH-ubiquinone oxidoreductase 105 kDa subunit [Coccidioides posadasii RMSCC 3488]KMP09464.1 NADH-ubiquinone oxidoreductase 105 kDa subunit [Coccidioides immitis RMSCC 2394]KMU78457.1 NADH-ubiquinone oxidoreductase subu|eukprot:XP_003072062.1 NADH-ubiquinone oxidoreductase, putative [Coccidioides posadasii C735 delta SOWgp]